MTELFEIAAVAFGLAGITDLPAVMDQLMRESNPAVLRENPHQVLLNFFCGFALGEAEAAGDAEDVGVDYHTFSFAEADSENDIGGLAGSAGDGDQLGESLWDFAVEFLEDFTGCALDGFGLVAEETGGADEFFEFWKRRFRHCGRVREAAKEFRGHHVDADVGALGGEDGGDQQFPGRAMREGALDVGVGFVEGFEDCGNAIGGKVAAKGFLRWSLLRSLRLVLADWIHDRSNLSLRQPFGTRAILLRISVPTKNSSRSQVIQREPSDYRPLYPK